MAKKCWKCNNEIPFGKKSFDKRYFESKKIHPPENFVKGEHICKDCFPTIVISCNPYDNKGCEYLFELIYKQMKNEKDVDDLRKRKNGLQILQMEFTKKDGSKCFKCGKNMYWIPWFDNSWVQKNIQSELPSFGQNSRLCRPCGKEIKKRKNQQGGKTTESFDKKLTKIILDTNSGLYYGGHKAYLAGGTFSDAQNGRLFLTEKYLVFIKDSFRESKRWRIEIPLDKVIVEDWKIDEKTRRKTMAGGGIGFGLFGGAGTIHDTGKAHDIVVPYVDENGITQAPRFGVASIFGGGIKKWAEALYQILAEIQKEKARKEAIPANPARTSLAPLGTKATENKIPKKSTHDQDPLDIIKLRLAKGEISKEEFEKLRKMIES